jgi:hypothetical protein
VDLRVAAADRLPLGERFALARLVVVLPRLAAAFFVVERLRLRGFSVVPVTASAMLVLVRLGSDPDPVVSRPLRPQSTRAAEGDII